MSRRDRRGLHAGLVGCVAALGCSDPSSPGKASAILVQPDTVAVQVDSLMTVTAEVLDNQGTSVPGATLTWHIFDTTIARLDAPGRVRGIAVGPTSMIVASDSAQLRVPVHTVVRLAEISAGTRTTCALSVSLQPYCWGIRVGHPRLVELAENLSVVRSGDSHSCGLTAAGDAYCWGDGPLGDGGIGGSDLAPAKVTGGHQFAEIGAGYSYSCGRKPGGQVYCWGSGSYDVMGGPGPFLTPQLFPGISATSLSLGGAHACAIDATSALYCWGYNEHGQLGSNADTRSCPDRCSRTPALVPGLPPVGVVAANDYHTCALTTAGEAWCWGSNAGGKLGNNAQPGTGCDFGNTRPGFLCSDTPVRVAGNLQFTTLALGRDHTCALTAESTMYCWGDNSAGQFGIETPGGSVTPILAAGGVRFRSISAAYGITCGMRLDDGRAYCWGTDWFNTLGNGSVRNVSSTTPSRVLYQP